MREIAIAPLAGVTVVETGGSVSAGFCTRLLHQLGADVLLVRDGDGPPIGREGPESSPAGQVRADAEYVFLADGKQIAQVGAAEAFAAADVIVRGSDGGPGNPDPVAEHDRLQASNRGLIYVYLSPFGVPPDGRDQPGWRGDDINAQAVGGLSSLIGQPDREPLVVPYDVGAVSQGLSAACAVLGALLASEAGGTGAFIDVASADVAASYSRMYTLLYRFYGIPAVRAGRRAPGSGGRYPMTILPCRDGDVVLIGRSRRDWERYLDMMGRPAWTDDPRYQDPLGIAMEYPEEVDALIAPWLAARTRAELSQLAQRHGVPLGSVRTVSEVLADPQMQFRQFFRPAEAQAGRAAPPLLPGFPARFRRPGQDSAAQDTAAWPEPSTPEPN
jgi:crotonobetainyl-CoA:carnitine CoA-transferase CaiB-like acyl-CoA transferase